MDDDARRAKRQLDDASAWDARVKPRRDPAATPAPAVEVIRLPPSPGSPWPRFSVVPPTHPDAIAAAERQARKWWEADRKVRIRTGACPDCGERLCPRVGPREFCVMAWTRYDLVCSAQGP